MRHLNTTTKWRGMTVSSVLQLPAVFLLIIIGIAIAVTMLFKGNGTELKSPSETSPQLSETSSGGK